MVNPSLSIDKNINEPKPFQQESHELIVFPLWFVAKRSTEVLLMKFDWLSALAALHLDHLGVIMADTQPRLE